MQTLLRDQKLCLEQSRPNVFFIHCHHSLHQPACFFQPCGCFNLFQPERLIKFHQLNGILLFRQELAARNSSRNQPDLHRNRQFAIGMTQDDTSETTPPSAKIHIKKYRKHTSVPQKIIICKRFLFRKQEFTLTFHCKPRITPSVSYNMYFPLHYPNGRPDHICFHANMTLLHKEFHLLFPACLKKKLLHILLSAFHGGKRPVVLSIFCITSRKYTAKFGKIKHFHSLLPIIFCQFGKLKQIFYLASGEFRHGMFY